MSRLKALGIRYGVDGLIVVAAIAAALGALAHPQSEHPGGSMQWVVPGVMAVVVLSLLLRRRMPFLAPATTWLLAGMLSFVDGRLVVGQAILYVAGMGAVVLLGNLRNQFQARVGLAIVLASTATLVYNDPTHATGDFFFTPTPAHGDGSSRG